MRRFEYYEGTECVQWYPEAASQSFKKGELVYLASGLLNVVVSSDTNIALGIAMSDATGTTNNWMPVLLAHTDTSFVGQSTNAGADITFAITHLATDCEYYVSSNVPRLDVTTSDPLLRAIALHPDHIPVTATATVAEATNAKVILKVMDEYSQAVGLDQA